ncbi:MAG: DnaA ATPase domain-containing protein, partial [Gammaproteobacteria bacterium]
MTGPQLALALRLPATSQFDNYVAGPNPEALAAVRQLAQTAVPGMLFLTGAAGTGKTHLLQAACRAAEAPGAYVPLKALAGHEPAVLEGLEQYPLVAIDDVQAIAGQTAWEEALFHLYNRLRDAGGRLLSAASLAPEQLALHLPDLRSRLAWGALYA